MHSKSNLRNADAGMAMLILNWISKIELTPDMAQNDDYQDNIQKHRRMSNLGVNFEQNQHVLCATTGGAIMGNFFSGKVKK
jgi:hypothetical protein